MKEQLQQYAGLADTELVAKILDGDSQAVSYLLVDRCGPALKYLAEVKYRSLHLEFSEVVSEVFLALNRSDWKALRDYRGHNQAGRACSLIKYVLCIASRLLWKKMDRAVKEIGWLTPLNELEDVNVPDEYEARRRLAADVIEAVMALEQPADRLVLLLYKIEERPAEEVATIMKTTVGNVYTRCSRALQQLRLLLSEGGAHA